MSAELRIKLTSAETPKLAHARVVGVAEVGVSPVYNLTVSDCPEYFANGVLVHNCRNGLCMALSTLISHAKPLQMGSYRAANEHQNNAILADPLNDELIEAEAQLID